MGAMASQIINFTIVYSTVYSGAKKKTSKLQVIGLCAGNSPMNGAQMASNAENVSLWWCLHGQIKYQIIRRPKSQCKTIY